MMDEPTENSDTVRIADDPVTISKTAERKPSGIVVTYILHTHDSRPSGVRVRDELPIGGDAENTEFHPDFEPANWGMADDELEFEVEVPPGRGVDIVFGIQDSDALDVETCLSSPTIESAQPVDAVDGERRNGGGAMFRSGSLSGAPEDDSDAETNRAGPTT